MASQGPVAAHVLCAEHAAQPEHVPVPHEQPREPVERHHADAPVVHVGQRLHPGSRHLLQLCLRTAAAIPTGFSAQTDEQGLQIFPSKARTQTILPAPVLNAFHIGKCSTGPNENYITLIHSCVLAISCLSLEVGLKGFE